MVSLPGILSMETARISRQPQIMPPYTAQRLLLTDMAKREKPCFSKVRAQMITSKPRSAKPSPQAHSATRFGPNPLPQPTTMAARLPSGVMAVDSTYTKRLTTFGLTGPETVDGKYSMLSPSPSIGRPLPSPTMEPPVKATKTEFWLSPRTSPIFPPSPVR